MSSLAPLLHELLSAYPTSASTGAGSTNVPDVQFFWAKETIPRTPLLYSAGIVIIGQGHKVGYLGDRKFRYDRETYLILGVPVPFECETHATREDPLLGIFIDIDTTVLHELVARVSDRLHLEGGDVGADPHAAVEPAPMSEAMLEATTRLLKCMRDPVDSKVLGRAAVNEVISRIHSDYREALSVDELAQENAMSVSSFHRAFKRVTGDSPLQYMKKVRLDKAKGLLVQEKMRVNNVAYEVGYESPSQFSREFKRYFKVPPSEANTLAYS